MEEINLRDLLSYFKKHLVLFIVMVLFVVSAGTFYSVFIQKPEYKAQATVILSSDKSKNTIQNEINANKNLIDTYTEVVKSHRVLDRVRREMQIDDTYEQLVKKVTVASLKDTEIISISVVDLNKYHSYSLANTIADTFTSEISSIYNDKSVNVLDRAVEPQKPHNVDLIKQEAIYMAAGIVLAVSVIFLMFYFDRTIKTAEQIEQLFKLPILGKVRKLETEKQKQQRKKRAEKNAKLEAKLAAKLEKEQKKEAKRAEKLTTKLEKQEKYHNSLGVDYEDTEEENAGEVQAEKKAEPETKPVVEIKAVGRKIIAEEKAKQEAAAAKEDYEAALNAKVRIEELEKQIANHTEDHKVTATVNDVAESVERMTGIPVSQMGATDIERLKDMGHRLQTKVIGQDKAVEAVAKAIRRNRAGFDEGNRPIGSFLFVGPTGVGKTELAKQLALDMFGTKDAIIRLDMSEYSDRTAVSKLIGTTAGYVGYDDNNNTLTERVRRNPYSIVLLDEIEKADPQVITLLLQVLDDGRLTDGQGNTVNFKNTVIIATSNAGFGYEANLTEDADKPELLDRLKPFFRPEFLNRFNAVIEFSHLSKEDLSKIVDLMLVEVNKTLAKKDIDLTVSDAAKEYMTEEGYDEVMGVRPLRRVVEQQIRDKVTDFHLDYLDAKHLLADMEDGELVIKENTNSEE